jgi:hypothetical protein
MIRATITALALSAALTAGTAHALTWETPNGQAQVADPDDKIQQQMGMTNSSGPTNAPSMYKFQGSGFSFGVSGGPQGQRDDQSNALRFGPQTPSDKRPGNARLNSVFGWQ